MLGARDDAADQPPVLVVEDLPGPATYRRSRLSVTLDGPSVRPPFPGIAWKHSAARNEEGAGCGPPAPSCERDALALTAEEKLELPNRGNPKAGTE